MCFSSHILEIVRLYSSIAHHRLLLREKLEVYPEVEVVSTLLPQEFEELNGKDERTSLTVEHGWAPRLSAEHAPDWHAGRFRELEVGVLTAVLCER